MPYSRAWARAQGYTDAEIDAYLQSQQALTDQQAAMSAPVQASMGGAPPMVANAGPYDPQTGEFIKRPYPDSPQQTPDMPGGMEAGLVDPIDVAGAVVGGPAGVKLFSPAVRGAGRAIGAVGKEMAGKVTGVDLAALLAGGPMAALGTRGADALRKLGIRMVQGYMRRAPAKAATKAATRATTRAVAKAAPKVASGTRSAAARVKPVGRPVKLSPKPPRPPIGQAGSEIRGALQQSMRLEEALTRAGMSEAQKELIRRQVRQSGGNIEQALREVLGAS